MVGVSFLIGNRSTVSPDLWGWVLATSLEAGSHRGNHPRSHWVFGQKMVQYLYIT